MSPMRTPLLLLCALTACGAEEREPPPPEPEPSTPVVPVYAHGEQVGELDPSAPPEPSDEGLTTVDLRDDFAPRIFAPAPELGELGTPPYRATYVKLADERLDDLPEDVEAERYLEVFGIFPTFRVLAARLADGERHRCHGEVDPAGLHELPYVLKYTDVEVPADRRRVAAYERELPLFRAEQESLGLDSLDALEGVTTRARVFAQFLKDRRRVEVVRTVQAHLRCDGLLEGPFVDGVLDDPTSDALAQWQRRQMLYAAGSIDETTLQTLRVASRELDFRAVLRSLRERVVDATGVIEDGSARQEWGTVLGRTLGAPELMATAGHEPREDGAADWVSPATEAAARELGWTSAESFTEFAAGGLPDSVAVRLPPAPAYHGPHMTLRAEIDRGDVSYELPRDVRGPREPLARRPIVTVFARHEGQDIALVQWPTTIGGWMRENARGGRGAQVQGVPGGPPGVAGTWWRRRRGSLRRPPRSTTSCAT